MPSSSGQSGQTVAALEAAELHGLAIGGIAELLDVLANDESRHAALAFRIVRWAVCVGGAPVSDAIAALGLMDDAAAPFGS